MKRVYSEYGERMLIEGILFVSRKSMEKVGPVLNMTVSQMNVYADNYMLIGSSATLGTTGDVIHRVMFLSPRHLDACEKKGFKMPLGYPIAYIKETITIYAVRVGEEKFIDAEAAALLPTYCILEQPVAKLELATEEMDLEQVISSEEVEDFDLEKPFIEEEVPEVVEEAKPEETLANEGMIRVAVDTELVPVVISFNSDYLSPNNKKSRSVALTREVPIQIIDKFSPEFKRQLGLAHVMLKYPKTINSTKLDEADEAALEEAFWLMAISNRNDINEAVDIMKRRRAASLAQTFKPTDATFLDLFNIAMNQNPVAAQAAMAKAFGTGVRKELEERVR